jgi:hypothetical protein
MYKEYHWQSPLSNLVHPHHRGTYEIHREQSMKLPAIEQKKAQYHIH